MKTEKCPKCGKNVLLSCVSNSEVRRAGFFMKLCVCPENNTPGDLKMIVAAVEESHRARNSDG
jgi:hypothetical protein